MLKTTYDKLPLVKINYRKYKNFDRNSFLHDLRNMLYNYCINDYNDFYQIFTIILDRHAPMKTKFLSPNNSPHITKELRQAIMKRSRLNNLANKTKNPEYMAAYKRQRSLIVNLNRQAKKSIFSYAKSKSFWKIFKASFFRKTWRDK